MEFHRDDVGPDIAADLFPGTDPVSYTHLAVILIGAIRNWNWLCDPTGTRDAHRHSRGYRRVVFFLLGVLLIVVSIWGFVLKLK